MHIHRKRYTVHSGVQRYGDGQHQLLNYMSQQHQRIAVFQYYYLIRKFESLTGYPLW